MKKELKSKRGITLVALVVTIVVLLILAGITITMLFSDNGIIIKAREAAEAVDKAQGDTLNGLNDLADDMNVALGGAPKVKEKGELVPINTKFATYTDSTSSDVVTIPGGYCVVKDSNTDTNNVASGLVISDLAGDTLDNEPSSGVKGNQFVWVPVNSAQLVDMYGVDNNGKKHGKLYKFTSTGKTALNWTEAETTPKVMNITATSGNNINCEPDIVTRYDGSDVSNANDASYFKEAISETMTGVQFKEQLEKEFDEMIASVQKYGGFYIGRYETSGLSATEKTTKPTVQKGGTVADANWWYQYQEIKNMSNNNTTASMIWGCQFDRTLEWIAQTNEGGYGLLTDSSTWGNHSNYKTVTGDESTPEAGKKVLPSGTNLAWQKNHIYDLAGNSWDWTFEVGDSVSRVARGGDCHCSGSDSPASYRNNVNTIGSFELFASRAILYIK